jgi:predicted transcriptional regulator
MKWLFGSAQDDQVILNYIKRHSEPCDVTKIVGSDISLGRLYMSLKRLRRQGLIDSIEGDAIAGGARYQYYFVKEVQ